jgi:methyl-accepting chemotaxis protein
MATNRKTARAPATRKVSVDALHLADLQGQLAAIGKAQAVIEFALDGAIITANDNLLNTLGYRLEEIKGQHHSMFVEPAYRTSDEYRRFWEKLGRGEYDAGQYKRIGKGGKEVWIQASYNPIFNPEGKPYKVVKFATDITGQVSSAAENGRIKSALDKASASVMLADDNLNIIYVNEAAQKLFREAETEMRRDVPALHADRIIGSNIDIFHKNPSHQRQLLANLRSTHIAEVRVGGRVMRIAASPVVNGAGNRFGTVVEWFDRTQEVRSEEQVAAVVKKALEGDLVERLPMEGKTGFFATLGSGLNELLDNTAQMVYQIKSTANEVHRGAEEISQGNANLSQRTEEQSSSLEETASSMEEMTSTVKQNADNAGQANQLATAARDQAEKGGAVVGKAVKAMADINESSKKIADIISVIDEIAFQTNLLALNAAVEAARAGEQGRGFAVVATEVRSLAGRSATAAKEIKDLIQDSVRKVEDGSVLVTQSGQTLEQIVTSVKKVSDIVAEIASASREQSSGIEQVNKAVMQMDEMTQQNAALVEQATAASQSMADQARDLTNMMERYRLSESLAASTPAAATRNVKPAAAAPTPERRGPNRTWAGKPKIAAKPSAVAAEPAEAPVAQRKAAANGGDSEWREF